MQPLPLTGVRVLDLTDGLGEPGSRYLADLGADVIRVEPPGGSRSRDHGPVVAGVSLSYLTHNANKRAVELDLGSDADRDRFLALAATAAIVFDGGPAGHLAASGISVRTLRTAMPLLVIVSVSDFGCTGPYRDWVGTEQVHLAMAGVLSRSGLPGLPPLLPPGSLATESAGLQAAWAAVAAYLRRLRTGDGDHVDVSAYEAVAQVFDPGYGIGGSASGGVPSTRGPRGRPDARHLYPIFRCRDGWVRICVLSPRQWAGMFRWLGSPPELADPGLAAIGRRHAAAVVLLPAYEKHFAGLTADEAVAQGQEHGVPTATLLTLAEVTGSEHFAARQAFTYLPVSASRRILAPNGLVEIDGRRAGIRHPAPAIGAHTAEVLGELTADRPEATPRSAQRSAYAGASVRPLDGVRVLDLGVIVVGAELGRLLADLGAEVIKVENSAFPDGSRQSVSGAPMSSGFALGHRNETSFGVNLRDPRGRDLFLRLAASADVVLSNFRPGTMESLGLGYADLAAVSPGIIVADSSAFGPSGPWSRRMGYGPLVRASSGLSDLWRYPAIEDSYSDASTTFPDHICARVGAIAVVAKLIERRRTGRGGTVSVAQAETILTELSLEIAQESIQPGTITAVGNAIAGDAPRGVYPCAGDDEWAVITVRDDADFAALATAIGQPGLAGDPRYATPDGRVAHRAELDAAVAAWTAVRMPRQVAGELQAARVPAGPMQRVTEYPDDPHLSERRFLTEMRHPLIARPMLGERACAVFERMPDAPLDPAPLAGQHTREIARRLLGLSTAEIKELIADGVLEEAGQGMEQSMTTVVTSVTKEQPAVLTERHGHVLLITLNRPDARNAVNLAISAGVGEALEEAEHDLGVWAVVVTGAGNKAFCAGADLKAIARGEPLAPKDPARAAWGFAGYVTHHISKPTIAAVNGFALGGGTEICLASDLVVAADTASFGLPEVKRGILAGAGGVFRLPAQVPKKIAMEMILTGEPVTARRALELGLVNRVVPQADVLAAALELAAKITANAPLAVQASKRIANGIRDGRVAAETAFWELSDDEGRAIRRTADAAEGPRAFAEKRAPNWQAR